MRKYQLRWVFLLDELLQRKRETVGRVLLQQRVLHACDFAEGFGCCFRSLRFSRCADHNSVHGLACLLRQSLSGRKRFPTNAAYAAVAFFQHNPNAGHRTRTSNFSFSTNAAAASFAVPGRICVDRCFCGKVTASSTATGEASGAVAVMLRISLVLARLMPIKVA